MRACRLLRSLRGLERAVANGAASEAASSEAHPHEEHEDVSNERRCSIASVTTVPDYDHLASSSSALALPEAVRHRHALFLGVLVAMRRWATPATHERACPCSLRAVLENSLAQKACGSRLFTWCLLCRATARPSRLFFRIARHRHARQGRQKRTSEGRGPTGAARSARTRRRSAALSAPLCAVHGERSGPPVRADAAALDGIIPGQV